MLDNERTIVATEGKVFRRIYDGFISGNKVHLGMDYRHNPPREEKREHYEEIDAPADDKPPFEQ